MAGTRPKPDFEIRPHPQAPAFSEIGEGQLVMQQVIDEVTSGNFNVSNDEVRKYLRQAGFVSLWFFLKYIAGFSGPFDKLNDDLHLDMCNFRQSDLCMKDGAHSAAFVPRGTYKSTIFTAGGATWELLRNPDLKIRIVNAIVAKAQSFKLTSQRVFDANEFFGWLYPEYVPENNASRWNEVDMVLPNRTRYYNEPSLKAGGATGAAEGDHHDLIIMDDLIGLESLDAANQSNVTMTHARNWYNTNSSALLTSAKRSRIAVVATRYAADDVYEIMTTNAHTIIGYKDETLIEHEDGEYALYYRLAIEDNAETNEREAIFPEELDEAELERIMRRDPWTAFTQYMNLPQKAGLAEFYEMETKECRLRWDAHDNEYYIDIPPEWSPEAKTTMSSTIPLRTCDVVMAVDPAGSEDAKSIKTSRTSIGVWAMDSKERCFRIWQKVGFFAITQVFDHIFEGHKLLGNMIRATVIETNAMQRILGPLVREEEMRRNTFINAQEQPAKGNKVARIRNVVGLKLSHGLIYLAPGCVLEFEEERKKFPTGHRMDVLDEAEKAISSLVKPMSDEERLLREEEEDENVYEASLNVFGY